MEPLMTATFSAINTADIPILTSTMTRAFAAEYRQDDRLDATTIEPYTSDAFFRTWLSGCTDIARYKILAGDTLIGGIVVWQFEQHHNVLGLLFVDPGYQNHGIGHQAWQFLEATFPETRRWSLLTPVWSGKNRHFYEQCCGFHAVGEEHGHVVYEKDWPQLA
jgi:GNAT superfamily N-acetyltransferase